MKTFDVVVQDLEFMNKFCNEHTWLYVWKNNSSLTINKDAVSKVFFNCKEDPDDFGVIISESGYYIDWKFIKMKINKNENGEYYV